MAHADLCENAHQKKSHPPDVPKMTSHTMFTAGAAAALLCCCQLNTSCAAAGPPKQRRLAGRSNTSGTATAGAAAPAQLENAGAAPVLPMHPATCRAPHLHQPLARLHSIVVAGQLLSVHHVHLVTCSRVVREHTLGGQSIRRRERTRLSVHTATETQPKPVQCSQRTRPRHLVQRPFKGIVQRLEVVCTCHHQGRCRQLDRRLQAGLEGWQEVLQAGAGGLLCQYSSAGSQAPTPTNSSPLNGSAHGAAPTRRHSRMQRQGKQQQQQGRLT